MRFYLLICLFSILISAQAQVKKITYSIRINSQLISNPTVSLVSTNSDSAVSNTLYTSQSELRMELKVTYNDTTYNFELYAPLRSTSEKLDIYILPQAMSRLTDHASVTQLNQLKKLSPEQIKRFNNQFPFYRMLFDPTIQIQNIQTDRTKHVVLYRITDALGTHFTGMDSIN